MEDVAVQRVDHEARPTAACFHTRHGCDRRLRSRSVSRSSATHRSSLSGGTRRRLGPPAASVGVIVLGPPLSPANRPRPRGEGFRSPAATGRDVASEAPGRAPGRPIRRARRPEQSRAHERVPARDVLIGASRPATLAVRAARAHTALRWQGRVMWCLVTPPWRHRRTGRCSRCNAS